ncbi:MAG: haloacid dehalogenase-like hydrolase [Bacteroidales bacterium]|jgi:HAD superfamily hydrolase (TIGR01490 family)|nr:haloacid dehalogenase-like hydrolase [Bacteroidales bacterium]
MKKTLVAFDFDGTLTTKDSFIEFVKFSKGKRSFYCGFLLFSPVLVAMKLRIIANWRVKQWIISYFFKGMNSETFNTYCTAFIPTINAMLRHETIAKLKEYQKNACEVCIVSASVENWVQAWAQSMGILTLNVLATQLEITNNTLTGRLHSKNCYGQEKVNRLLLTFPFRENYRLVAYGDSSGDKELLNFADEAHWISK